MHISIYIYIYIYVYTHTFVYTYAFMYIYIYIYRERERDVYTCTGFCNICILLLKVPETSVEGRQILNQSAVTHTYMLYIH